MLAIVSRLAAPVSCSAIRKSDAVRTPLARPFGRSSTVGLPAPVASAMWSKPSANAPASSSVPPKRTPPYSAKRSRRSSSSRIILRKFLSQRTVMPYSATPPKPAIRRSSSGSVSVATSRTGANGTRSPAIVMPDSAGVERLDLEPVDADDRVAVVDEVMRQREAGGPQADDQHALARPRQRHRPAQVERIPARQQRVDLEAPRQRQHVLQQPRFRLRDVDRILLLVDARLHAVVADAMAGGRHHRIVDADHRQRAERHAFGAQLVELGDPLLQRTAGERHVERRLLERHLAVGGLLLGQSARARVLALLVAPDAVVRLVEAADEVGAGVGQREALAPAQRVIGRQLPRGDAVRVSGLDRHQLHEVELARRAEQHAAAMRGAAGRRVRRPRRVAGREVERLGMRRSRRPASAVTALANASSENGSPSRASSAARSAGAVERRGHVRLVRVHRLALHELALDGEQRRQFVMRAPRARALPARCRRARRGSPRRAAPPRAAGRPRPCARARRARRARRAEALGQRRVGRVEVREEGTVDGAGAGDRVQVGELEAVGELEHAMVGRGRGSRSTRTTGHAQKPSILPARTPRRRRGRAYA